MNATHSGQSFFNNVSFYFDLAASFTDHPQGLLEQIKACNSVYSFQGVMDDFDRALTHAEGAPVAFADGLRLVRRRLDEVLRSNDVTPLESVGHPFDPNLHEAVSVVEGDGQESGVVHAEERRGYLWDGELLRPSRVTVVR